MCMSLEKSFSCSRISFTSGAVLQKVLPVAFSLAALRRHVALGGEAALVSDIHHLNHHAIVIIIIVINITNVITIGMMFNLCGAVAVVETRVCTPLRWWWGELVLA